jgi:predicted Zn-dependent protease
MEAPRMVGSSPAARGAPSQDLLSSAEVSTLVELGFWALDEKLLVDAEELFDRLSSVQSANPYPRIGSAMVAWAKGQRDDAIQALLAVLQDHPDAVFTRSLLAQFMKACGQAGWETYAQEVLARVQAGSAADMARELLRSAGLSVSGESQSKSGLSMGDPRLVRRV